MAKYHLDPDYRPRIPMGCKEVRCNRCQKIIKNPNKAVRGIADHNNHYFTPDDNGTDLIGLNCWKVIKSHKVKEWSDYQ